MVKKLKNVIFVDNLMTKDPARDEFLGSHGIEPTFINLDLYSPQCIELVKERM